MTKAIPVRLCNFYYFILCLCFTVQVSVSHARLEKGFNGFVKDSTGYEAETEAEEDSSKIVLSDYVQRGQVDSLNVEVTAKLPFVTLQQMLKGKVNGLYVAEPTGEPGSTSQTMLIRGLTGPISGNKQIGDLQPAVYINGIPLITDHPFIYNIKNDELTPIGPYNNLLAALDPDNIETIEILKGPDAVASLGPRASNGAISITMKNAKQGKSAVTVNSYFGTARKDRVTPINAATENRFRRIFYDKYGTDERIDQYPAYLRDVTNANYYGPSNWTDLYYQNKSIYSVNASLTGGSASSNFRLFLGNTKNGGTADNTGLDRYNASFFINMAPLKWLTVSSMINATRLERDRNRNFRDRFSEMKYLPDMTNPISPTREIYSDFLSEYDRFSFDKNKSNVINGYFSLLSSLNKWTIRNRVAFDYNEGLRDLFWPSSLLDGNNFVSNYFSYNQRVIVENKVDYSTTLNQEHALNFTIGQSYQHDQNKYNYSYGYKGSSDFIRINEVEGDPDKKDTYLVANDFFVYRYTDKLKSSLLSFYGSAQYRYKDLFSIGTVLRTDGSSNVQPSDRWFFSYEADGQLNLKNLLFEEDSPAFTGFNFNASYGRLGTLPSSDRAAAGPQYTVDLGWTNNPAFYSYAGFGTLSRAYTDGWIGYNIPWQYNEELNLGMNATWLKNRLGLEFTYYNKNTRNAFFAAPVNAESGFLSTYSSGLSVNNQGLESTLFANILPEKKNALGWSTSLNITYQTNKLLSLPNGKNMLKYESQNLQVGQPIDRFWIFTSNGTFGKDSDVPVNPENNEVLSYKGLPLKAGDPRWIDLNNDYRIDDQDKINTGNYLPRYFGSFDHQLSYKKFKLNLSLYFALKRNILKQYVANRLDFINRDAQPSIHSVKEIFFWKKDFEVADYPIYNPWSPVRPYRLDQDIFLENGAFAKLRSATLSYEFRPFKNTPGNGESKKMTVYVTGANLFTITSYSGRDPELVGFTGIDDGYGISIPRTFVAGFKLEL